MAGPRPLHHRCVVVALSLLGACARVDAPPESGDAAVAPSQGSPFGGGGGGTTAGGGAGAPGVDGGGIAAGGTGAPSGPNADGPNCGLTKFAVERLPPNVLIVLDKSTSMRDFAKGLLGCLLLQCNSKWKDMTDALTATVTATQATINWGLQLFPTDNGCGVSDVAAPVAPNNASVVNGVIASNSPSGSTPTRLALEGGGRYLMGLSTPNPRYIVLATDGLPTCSDQSNGGADDAATIMAVTGIAAAGIPVYVIGVGTAGGGDATLSAMAMAGGKPRAADPAYYPVTTSADLSATLSAIGGQVVSCTLPIQDPPDPTNVAVDADGVRVPRSATDGWDLGPDMKTIQLSGTWCANYQNGTIKDVETIFGCPGVIIP